MVRTFVDRRGPALHHVAFAVEGLDEALADLRSRGARLVDEQARPGGMRTRIAFVHPSSFGGLLVELVEEQGTQEGEPDVRPQHPSVATTEERRAGR